MAQKRKKNMVIDRRADEIKALKEKLRNTTSLFEAMSLRNHILDREAAHRNELAEIRRMGRWSAPKTWVN